MFTTLRFQSRVPVVADRYDVGKSGISQREAQIDYTERGTRQYSLKQLKADINHICREFQLENLVAFFGANFKVPKPLPMTDRRKVLSNDSRFCRNFLEEGSYNTLIIDLDTSSAYEHGIITTYIADSLVNSSPKSGVMLIHISCYGKVEMLTPFCLSTALLQFVMDLLPPESFGDCLSIKVGIQATQNKTKYYEPTMQLLEASISLLEKHQKKTMHFIFSGIQPCDTDEDQRLALARFIIDMGRLASTVLPKGEERMVKCVFCGDILFGCLLDDLKSEKKVKCYDPEEQEIFRKILMLKWDRIRGEGPYSWLHWSTKVQSR